MSKEPMKQRIQETAKDALSSLGQYAKDVVTLQVAKENFFKDDGNLWQVTEHGATELANVVLHGHVAPLYAGYSSPDQTLETHQPELVATQETSILDSLVDNARAMEAERQMEMEFDR